MQQHYDAAMKLTQAGKLTAAAEQYQAFLADALSELAMGYSLARDYTHAAPLFQQALALEPDSSSLLLDSARTALSMGNLDDAKAITSEYLKKGTGAPQQLAQAHQLLGSTLLKLNQDREARKEFEAAVALDSTFANAYDLAIACLDLNDDKCAAQIFGEMEKSFGDSAQLHMAIGRAYGESDFQPKAIAELRRAIQEDPRLPGAHYLLAATLLGTGGDEKQVDAAETALKQELAISPRDARSYAALGKLEANRNHYVAAEKYLKRAIALDPQNPDPCLFVGQMYFGEHNFAEAETYLRQSIRLTADPSRNRYQIQRAHFLLGRILMRKGQRDAGQEQLQISRDLANQALSQDRSRLAALIDTAANPDSPRDVQRAVASAANALKTIDPQRLRNAEEFRERLEPAIADAYNNLGAIAATHSDYSSATMYFKKAAEWEPSMAGLDYNLGRAAFAASRFADAVPPLSRYVKSHPEDSGARSVLGISEFMTGNYTACIHALQPVIETSNLAPQAQYVYAVSLVKTGQARSGIDRLRALEKVHPEIPDVHRALTEAIATEDKK